MATDATHLEGSLAGIAACAQSMVQLCVSDADRFHRDMADELRLTLFEPVPGKPGEVVSTLFRPTGEFDLEVELRISVDRQQLVTVRFDGFRVASCSSNMVLTTFTARIDGAGTGTGEAHLWSLDHDEAALWASGAGLAPDDLTGVIQETEAAALVAWEHLAKLVRCAQRDGCMR